MILQNMQREITDLGGILVVIEKTFDTLNQKFLVKVLQKFNFGKHFFKGIRTFSTNLSSCMLNSGFAIIFFCVSRGVRQGDLLSALHSILGNTCMLH